MIAWLLLVIIIAGAAVILGKVVKGQTTNPVVRQAAVFAGMAAVGLAATLVVLSSATVLVAAYMRVARGSPQALGAAGAMASVVVLAVAVANGCVWGVLSLLSRAPRATRLWLMAATLVAASAIPVVLGVLFPVFAGSRQGLSAGYRYYVEMSLRRYGPLWAALAVQVALVCVSAVMARLSLSRTSTT